MLQGLQKRRVSKRVPIWKRLANRNAFHNGGIAQNRNRRLRGYGYYRKNFPVGHWLIGGRRHRYDAVADARSYALGGYDNSGFQEEDYYPESVMESTESASSSNEVDEARLVGRNLYPKLQIEDSKDSEEDSEDSYTDESSDFRSETYDIDETDREARGF